MENIYKKKIQEYLNNERAFSADLIDIEVKIDNSGYTGYNDLVIDPVVLNKYECEIISQLQNRLSNFCKFHQIFFLKSILKIELLPSTLVITTDIYHSEEKFFSLEPIFVMPDEDFEDLDDEPDDLTLICETIIESLKNNQTNEVKSPIFNYRHMVLVKNEEHIEHHQVDFFCQSEFLLNFIKNNQHILKIKKLVIEQKTTDKLEFNFRFTDEHKKEFSVSSDALPYKPHDVFSILCSSGFLNIPYDQIKDKETHDILEIIELAEY